MSDFMLKVADVIDKAAALLDVQESEKQTVVKTARDRTVKALAEKFAAATGDELPTEMLEKLAASDEDVLTTVSRLVEKTGGPVESLGGSSEKTAGAQPQTKAERTQAAYDRFGSFINS